MSILSSISLGCDFHWWLNGSIWYDVQWRDVWCTIGSTILGWNEFQQYSCIVDYTQTQNHAITIELFSLYSILIPKYVTDSSSAENRANQCHNSIRCCSSVWYGTRHGWMISHSISPYIEYFCSDPSCWNVESTCYFYRVRFFDDIHSVWSTLNLDKHLVKSIRKIFGIQPRRIRSFHMVILKETSMNRNSRVMNFDMDISHRVVPSLIEMNRIFYGDNWII